MPSLAISSSVETKDLSVFIYQAGDSDLAESMKSELEEIKKVSSTNQVNIIVLQDLGSSETTKIWKVNNGSLELIHDFQKNIDTGNWHTLVEYFSIAQKQFPARKYLLNISSHGNGWLDDYSSDEKGTAYDYTSGNHISTFELGRALAKIKDLNGGKKLWTLELYSCLLSSVEVIYEISDSVEYVVASPLLTYSKDSQYETKLKYLVNSPNTNGQDYLKNTLEKTSDETNSYFVGIETKDLKDFAKKMKIYSSYLSSIYKSNSDKILSAVSQFDSIAYKVTGYQKIEKLLFNIDKKVNDPKLTQLTSLLLSRISKIIVAKSGVDENSLQGISIWLPLAKSLEAPTQSKYYKNFRDSYSKLKWNQDSDWLTFIDLINVKP